MDRRPENPYAPPTVDTRATTPTAGEHEAVRRAHFNAEINIKGLGALALVGALVNLLVVVTSIPNAPIDAAIAFPIAAGLAFAGVMLRRLAPIGRTVFTVLVGLGALRTAYAYYLASTMRADLAPVPAAILGQRVFVTLMMLLLWGKKGALVFSPHYRTVIIPATPQVQYKMSLVLVVLLMLLAFAVLAITFILITG